MTTSPQCEPFSSPCGIYAGRSKLSVVPFEPLLRLQSWDTGGCVWVQVGVVVDELSLRNLDAYRNDLAAGAEDVETVDFGLHHV